MDPGWHIRIRGATVTVTGVDLDACRGLQARLAARGHMWVGSRLVRIDGRKVCAVVFKSAGSVIAHDL